MNNVNNYGFRNEQSFSLTANTWQHLAITKSGTTCNFYLNGDLVNSQYCDIHYSGAQYLVFGSHYAITTRYWNGIMDEVAFYNRALPLEEIQRQYQNGLVGKGYTTEVCNGIDDDCDGTVDNGLTAPSQSCTVGTGACFATGTQVKTCNGVSGWSNDWGACSAIAGSPTAETCNGIDDDCDGTVDEYYACTWTGFFQPVDNLPTLNQVNSGRAIPVKFSLGGNMGLDIFAAGYPKSGAITSSPTATVDAIETTVTAGGSSLTYDPVADQYNYVWKTDKAWTGCRQLVVKLNDGTIHYANFKFK